MLPSTRTFGVTELLEMILENATPQDLLLWQRVNKMWYEAIQKSPQIQEKLFFRINPLKKEDKKTGNPFIPDPYVWNPLNGPAVKCEPSLRHRRVRMGGWLPDGILEADARHQSRNY